MFSSHQISSEIQTYLIDIIKNCENKEEKLELADRLASFLPELFEKDFLYEFNLSDDFNPMQKFLNVFYGYWTVLSSLGGERNYILDEFKGKFLSYIRDLSNESILPIGDSAYEVSVSFKLNLSYQILNHSWLNSTFFYRNKYMSVNLEGTHLNSSWLYSMEFNKSDLSNVYFSYSDLVKVDFIDCDLSKSNFTDVSFSDCTFQNTKLNNIYIDDENAEYLRQLGVEFTRYGKEENT